ncbi:hypothetical protein QAD02_006109 [Eretmocerus hayati]|uniref:Uncharacterized protein n=1 Tax=Eretmocerus hayati TaxID=131215 RepID=A0ACC2N0C9_9HYME|nr:hypothetical protein QAD02_006109 [Eretmocerus hayati]
MATIWSEKIFLQCAFFMAATQCFLSVSGLGSFRGPNPLICQATSCKETGKSITQNLDWSVQPCQDFYKFACGNYMASNDIVVGEQKTDLKAQIREEIRIKLRDSIERITPADPEFLQKLSGYYYTCINEEKINKNSLEEFIKVTSKLGGWPVLTNSWHNSNFDWKQLMFNFRMAGLPYTMFVNVRYMPEITGMLGNVIHMDEAVLEIPPGVLVKGLRSKGIKAYFDFMVNIASLFGVDRKQGRSQLIDTLHFEIELAKISLELNQKRYSSQTAHRATIRDLSKQCPSIDWLDYLTRILGPTKPLNLDDTVIILVPGYISKFCALMKRTRSETLANYAFWKALFSLVDHLNSDIRHATDVFYSEYTGQPIAPKFPRWKECVNLVRENMHLAAGALFVREHFDRENKKYAEDIIKSIRQSFRDILQEVSWMSPSTKKAAILKLDEMDSLIGYPGELLIDERLDSFYKNLVISSKSLLLNGLNMNYFETKLQHLRLRHKFSELEWTYEFGDATSVNAAYRQQDNTFMILAGILQGKYLSAANSQYMNFANIGSVIGHEMMHAFDELGHQFDHNGKLCNWWDCVSQKIFMKKTQCFIDQYNALGISNNIPVDGALSVGENIADNVGVKLAYLAYERWQNEHGQEPGHLKSGDKRSTNLNSKQLFWLSYANTFCSSNQEQEGQKRIPPGIYAPERLRVNVPLANSVEFARDFGCPAGSLMNPTSKCDVWKKP